MISRNPKFQASLVSFIICKFIVINIAFYKQT